MTEITGVEASGVRALEGTRREIVFEDDTMGLPDLTDVVNLGPVTEPLRSSDCFHRLSIGLGTPTWPNGCDLDPINARMRMREAGTLGAVSAAAQAQSPVNLVIPEIAPAIVRDGRR